MLTFNQIPINIRTPGQYVEFDNTRANQGLPAIQHKILVLGQRLATGTVAAGIPTQIASKEQAETYFGRGSMLSAMFNALKTANSYTETWALALDDNAAGVLATGTVTITGPATAAGTVNLYIAGTRIQVAVANADTATVVATAIAAAVNANTTLPVTAGSAVGVVTLTARHKGENGNAIDVRVNYYQGERLPTGIAVAIVAVGSVIAGTANPDVATAITAMGGVWYHTIIVPWTDASNLTKVETEMTRRYGPLVMQDGHCFAAGAGSHATIATLGNSRNHPNITIMGVQKSPTPPWVLAAITGAIDAYEPDPARPRQTLLLPGVLAPADPDRYMQTERQTHLTSGISTYIVDSGGNCLIERLITTYKTNAFGVADTSYLDIETMRTIAYLRYSVRARIATKYPRCKLANDGTQFAPGQAVVTPNIIRAEMIALFQDWELAGLAENREQFIADLIVERDADPNRVNAIIPPDCVNQFRIFAAQVQFRI